MAEPGRDPAPADIATAGLASAAAVVERMLQLGRAATSGLWLRLPVNGQDPAGGWPIGPSDGADQVDAGGHPIDRARQARRFRADAERIVELYADFTRMLVDGAASLAEQAAGVPATSNGHTGPADVLVLGPASAGATTTTTAWLHVLDGPPAAPAPLHASELLAHDGARVKASALRCAPDHLDTSTARSSTEVRVTVKVPKGTAPGTYHGHLLATGLPEVVLALRLEVVA